MDIIDNAVAPAEPTARDEYLGERKPGMSNTYPRRFTVRLPQWAYDRLVANALDHGTKNAAVEARQVIIASLGGTDGGD